MKISLITATYNREDLLPNLYNSICNNYKTYKDIEWIIVDDGSSDNTKELISKWIKESKFKIDYHYQENAGKMRAINKGMKYITGDIVIEIDSDDYLLEDSLVKINSDYENINDDNVYGIIYKRDMGDKDTSALKELNGKVFKLFDIYYKYGYEFDMTLTFKANVRKEYEYLVCEGEKFVTEARTYYKIDQDYKGMLLIDDPKVSGEYMEDGYSKNIKNMFKKYPKGYYEFFKECLGYVKKDTLFKKRLYFIKHFILFGYLNNKKKSELIKSVNGFNKLLVIILVIPGYMKARKF